MSFEALREDVVDRGLCARCGLCVGVCPVNVLGVGPGLYPELTGTCTDCGLCNRVCPGADVDLPELSQRLFDVPYDPADAWGTQRRVFVGHPIDDTVRKAGASGGLTTGLLLHLLKSGRIRGAAVVGMDPEHPYKPKSILARTEEEIRAAAKSKYCIVPSMDVLAEMRSEEGPFAVVVLPCQAHGLQKLRQADPRLASKIYCTLGLYCHYNMEPAGYLDVLKMAGIDPADIARFDFRGGGWPGGFFAVMKDGRKQALHDINIKNVMTVMLRLYGAERCYLCTDSLAEFADLGLGDFWAIDYADRFGRMSWSTLVSERTERGREVLESAVQAGDVDLTELPPDRLSKRTANFSLEKKREGFVRLRRRARRGQPCPDYHHEIPRTTFRAWAVEAVYGSAAIFRSPRMRRFALRVLFSRFGEWLDKLNTLRKSIFLRFHGN